MSDFNKRWMIQQKESFGKRIKEAIRPPDALRDRLSQAQRAIKHEITKLDTKARKLQEKDRAIFNKVVSAVQRHDTVQASAVANELAENRKMLKTVFQTKTVLEQIDLRLNTVSDLGDIVVTLSPVASAVKSIKGSLAGIMPEAGSELEEIGGMLSNIIMDAGQLGGVSLTFEPSNEEAEKILSEAAAIAERRADERLPEIPSKRFEESQEQTDAAL